MDNTSLPVKKGHRIFILSGARAGEKFVVTKINSPTLMTVRRYNILDKLIEWIWLRLVELVVNIKVWLEDRFGGNDGMED